MLNFSMDAEKVICHTFSATKTLWNRSQITYTMQMVVILGISVCCRSDEKKHYGNLLFYQKKYF